ncbi:MAG: NAD kinase [Arachnia sp.]
MNRTVAVLLHPDREEALRAAKRFIEGLGDQFRVLTFPDDMDRVRAEVPSASLAAVGDEAAELAVVFGGDGSILRAAEWARPLHVPLLGVNLGHVGFLAELETSHLDSLVEAVVQRNYEVEQRLVLGLVVHDEAGKRVWESFAVNEVSLEKLAREKMLTVLVSLDERPLSRWGCDGVLVSTPTGSTAYAFSAGGPVVWPDVQAMLVVPLSAHALFNRPMVLSPESSVRLDLPPGGPNAIIWCDGRRSIELPTGYSAHVAAQEPRLQIARLAEQPFTTRLVKKFALPVDGWGGRRTGHDPC